MPKLTPFVVLLVTLSACSKTPAPTAGSHPVEPTLIDGISLRLVGIPDQRIAPTNAVLLDPENGVDATVLQGHHNAGDGLVVRFQPSSGKTDYLTTPGGQGSWSVLSVGGGEAWLGSHQQAHLYHLKPGANELERIDLPHPDDWIWSIDKASDGNLYLGTYPGGEILRYEIDSGAITNLGPVLPDDGRARYVRSLNGEFPGKLYLGMGAEPALIEWDLKTGQHQNLLPEEYNDRSFVYSVDRVGDYIAAAVAPHVVILIIDPATGSVVHTIPSPTGASMWLGNEQSVFLHDGKIYFGTRGDDTLWAYDLEDGTTTQVAAGLGGPIGIAQDRYMFTRDYFGSYYVYDLVENKVVIKRGTRFEGAGMDIHTLAPGPNGTVVGGTYINQGFFLYDPSADTLFAPGASVSFGGQIDQIVTSGGLIYLAHYTTARLTVYDPGRAWNPGMQDGANPHLVGIAGDDQDRFPTAVVGSDANIYLGSIPEYGMLGGALVIYRPGADSLITHRNVVQDQSVFALVELDGTLWGSTAVTGGIGSKATASSAKVFAWDMKTQTKIGEWTPVDGAHQIWGLDRLPDGRLVGGADSTMFIYDPAMHAVVYDTVAVPEVITKLLVSSDGWVYGLTEERFFRASPDLKTIETIDEDPGWWDSLAETDSGRLFTARGARLFEVVRRNSH
jgi:outer membrane protein assembly factor BamB